MGIIPFLFVLDYLLSCTWPCRNLMCTNFVLLWNEIYTKNCTCEEFFAKGPSINACLAKECDLKSTFGRCLLLLLPLLHASAEEVSSRHTDGKCVCFINLTSDPIQDFLRTGIKNKRQTLNIKIDTILFNTEHLYKKLNYTWLYGLYNFIAVCCNYSRWLLRCGMVQQLPHLLYWWNSKGWEQASCKLR